METWQKNALVNIASALKDSGLSQAAFAKNAKISKGHFNMVLNQHEPLTRQMVSSIAEATGIDTDWFYEDHSSTKPETPSASAMAQVILEQQKEIDSLRAQLSQSPIAQLNEQEKLLLEFFRTAQNEPIRRLGWLYILSRAKRTDLLDEMQRMAIANAEHAESLGKIVAAARNLK